MTSGASAWQTSSHASFATAFRVGRVERVDALASTASPNQKGRFVKTLSTSDPTVIEIGPGVFPSSITQAVLSTARALGEAPSGSTVTVSVPSPSADFGEREALREALRSLVHGSVLERPDVRANLVFGGSIEDHSRTVGYVNAAPFVVGASIDLGAAS